MKTIQEIKMEIQEKVSQYPIFQNNKEALLKNITEALEMAYISSLYSNDALLGYSIAKDAFKSMLQFIKGDNTEKAELDSIKELYNALTEFGNEYAVVENITLENENKINEITIEDNDVKIKYLEKEKTTKEDTITKKIEYTEAFSVYGKDIKKGKIKFFIQAGYLNYIYDELCLLCKKETKKNDDKNKVFAALNFISLFKITANMQNLAIKRSGYVNHLEMTKQELIAMIEILTKLNNVEKILEEFNIDLEDPKDNQCVILYNEQAILSPSYIINLYYERAPRKKDFTYFDYKFQF